MGETVAVVSVGGVPLSGATQWLESRAQEGPWWPIVGALRNTYSPDPDDTGKWLACRVKAVNKEARVVAPIEVQNVPGVPPGAGAVQAGACTPASLWSSRQQHCGIAPCTA